ncbi:unnamed protein product [Rhizoctonia solani]|uniref:25S rRNA adenine-N(1) methyltransferase n=1 Tax=Rhizoctonia solani TaxID=456999 RepID=A0A8H2WXT9_9AGAM|nr:unnamed protein product [Rhizoctonia solani]
MVRKRKPKTPITLSNPSRTKPRLDSAKPKSTRTLIRRFHVLIKRRAILEKRHKKSGGDGSSIELKEIEAEMESMGGLEAYQHMSAIGQGKDRGGGSESVLIGWMRELGMHKSGGKVRLLEVGALKHDNYGSCESWVTCLPIDLRSRHPEISEQDFLKLDIGENKDRWDVVSLSLVVNFVPDAKDRGKMLSIVHDILRPPSSPANGGLLFLVLPTPCVANSRYMTSAHLVSFCTQLGFTLLRDRCKPGGKVAYWLFARSDKPTAPQTTNFTKKIAREALLSPIPVRTPKLLAPLLLPPMSTLPVRGNRANKPHNRKPYDKAPVSSPSPPPQLARSKSTFFNAVKAVFAGWFSGGESTNGAADRDREDKHLKRRSSRSKLENGARPKRIRTVSPQRLPARKTGYLDPPEHMIRPAGSLGRSSKLAVTSDSEQSQLSVRNTPLGFGTYRAPRSPPSRRTPSIGSWFPPPASTRNSLAAKASQVHFGALPSNLDINAAISSYDDTRMQSRSPSVGVSVGLGRERTPSRAIPERETSLSLPLGPRASLSKATGSTIRASLSVVNPFSSLGKSSSLAPERRKSTLVWDDKVGVTKAGKPRAPTAPPAKNTAERLLNALENMHTLTGDAQRPRRRPPPYVQVPAPGPGDRRARMIQPYGEIKIAPNRPKKSGDTNTKSGLMKMLMKNKKDVQEEDMDMEEEAVQSGQPKEAAPAEPVSDKSKVKDVDTDMESDSAQVPKPATTTNSPLKVVDNFRPASQPPSRPGSSLRQSKTVTKRAHAHSAGRNRFSANNEEEEDDEAIEKRNAELRAVADANVFKVPDGFTFGVSSAPAAPKPVEPSKALEVVSPQPIPAKPAASSVLSFTPAAPAKEAALPASTFFGSKDTPKAAVPEVKNPFANVGATKPDIKVPEVPKWGSAPSSSAPTPPPKPTEGASPFANIGVPTKPAESVPAISFGKPAVTENPFGKADKPKSLPNNQVANIGKPAGDNPFASIGKSVSGNPFGDASKPAGDNPFAGIGTSDKSASPAPALPFSFGGAKSEGNSASVAPAPTSAPAVPSFFTKPTETPKPETPKPIEVPKPVVEPAPEAPKPSLESAKPSPFSFGASKPAEKAAASPFSFGAPAAASGSTSIPTPVPTSTPSPFSFGASSAAPVPTPAAPAPTAKPTFAFGLPASTPSPAPSLTEAPKKNPFDFSAPAAAPASTEVPKKSPFDFSVPNAPAPLAPTISKSPFDFASAAKPTEQPASPFAFGAASTPAPATAPAAAEKKNPFDFSGSNQKPASSTPFVFGAPSTSAPAATGFSFGAAPAPARPSTPPSGGDAAMEESPTRDPVPSKIVTSGFGNSAGSGFGSQTTSTGFAFGSTTNGTTPTPFGSTNGTTTAGPFGGPLSGANSNQSNGLASTTSNPSPFAFGANNNAGGGFGSTSSGFGANGSAATSSTPAFAFGAGGGFGQTPSATASPSNPFSQPNPTPFGQPNPTPNAFPTPASPFPAASPALSTVGFNTNTSAPASNVFGSNQSTTNGFPGSPATPAFAFGAPNPAAGTASPSTFSFGLPGGTSAPATPTGTNAPFVFGQGAAPPVPEGSPAPGLLAAGDLTYRDVVSPSFPLPSQDDSPGRFMRPNRRKKEEKIAHKAVRQTIKKLRRAEKGEMEKKRSRGLDELEETRRAVIGAVAVGVDFHSERSVAFNVHEVRQEDLDRDGDDFELAPELRIEPGSFVEVRRNGIAKWGVVLGYEYNHDGVEVTRTLLSSGEALSHPHRDIQFSVARVIEPGLAQQAGMGTFANESNRSETQARISIGKTLRDLNRRIETAERLVQSAAQRLYEHAKHSDGRTWSHITLADGVAFVADDRTPTLELTYTVHRHFMDDSLHYIADTFDHRLSNTFSVRPAQEIKTIRRVVDWARSNNPALDEFATKTRAIIEANTALRKNSLDQNPTRVESQEPLPVLNEADHDIINFVRYYLRQRRELQANPCSLSLPIILTKVSPSYMPLVPHTAFRFLEDLSLFAPWSNLVAQDVDLQLHEFIDTLDTPLPGSKHAQAVPPVSVNDTRIAAARTIDGLDNMRHDFGDLPVYVIDDSSAEELDDGISIERTLDDTNNVWLHVHIADPTSVLQPNDPLALDAARRTATAYFPEATYPMLPPTELSLDALVGREGASMNVLTFSLLVDPSGDILSHSVRPSVVRKVHVLRYDDVTRGALGSSPVEPLWPFGKPKIQSPDKEPRPVSPETLPDLQLLHKVTQNLAKARVSKTDSVLWSQPRALMLMEKTRILTDRDPRKIPRMYRGFPQIDYSVQPGTLEDPRHALDASRAMVAECMISAGRVASLFAQEHGIPMIYRSLAPPGGVAVDKYQPLLAKRDPYQGTVLYQDAIVQQLPQVTAQPMVTPGVHWQLGISAQEGYVRATSPLRRYLDMICHWQIKAALHSKSAGVKPPFSIDDLKVLMTKQHLQEHARRRAGNGALRLWAMRYIQNKMTSGGHEVLRSLEAVVTGRPMNMASSLTFVHPVMVTSLGLPAALAGMNMDNPPPIGSTIKVEIVDIELGYTPRLIVRQRRS